MTKFIELNGVIYNINQIKNIGYRRCGGTDKDPKWETVISLANEARSITLKGVERFDHLREERVVIPAAPGFTMVTYHSAEFISKFPVIAWAINPDSRWYATRPITSAGIAEWTDDWGVMQPDGIVVAADMYWDDYEAWLTKQKEEERTRSGADEKQAAAG